MDIVTDSTFTKKAVFVTGAASGIGRAAALAFARTDAQVALVDLSADGLQETARLIEETGGRSLTLTCDVTVENDVRDAVREMVGTFGRLDFAFNNAGIEQPVRPALDITKDEWDRVLDVNLTGLFLRMKHQIHQMSEQGGGAIVNTSGVGVKGFKGQAAYAAAKHGIIGLTRSVALDYAAAGIRINAICPGIIDTEMVRRFGDSRPGGREGLIADEPIGRLGKPEGIASAALWLSSDGAAFVTGTALVVDGGQDRLKQPTPAPLTPTAAGQEPVRITETGESMNSRLGKRRQQAPHSEHLREIMEFVTQQATVKAPADWFTGDVWFDVIYSGKEPSRMRANMVRFSPVPVLTGTPTCWARPCTSSPASL